eukprot:223580_1
MSAPVFTSFKHCEHEQPSKCFKLHCAIDFGTDGTGLAYAYNGKVYIHSRWNSTKYGDDVKPKTIILLDDRGNTIGFGKDAKIKYISTPLQKHNWMLFERFKMSLYENESYCTRGHTPHEPKRINIANELIAANGQKCSADFVFISAFKYILSEALEFMKKKKIKHVQQDEIAWIITVPSIWNDAAKHKMKQWAIAAGLVNTNIPNQCKIVYEPDCASLSIQHQVRAKRLKMKHNTKNNEHYFGVGDKYILVDAGGGTVDIACHEVLGAFGVKEIVHPSGGPFGSMAIDDEYCKLLSILFSVEWMNEFKRGYPHIYLQIQQNFQAVKCTLYRKVKKRWYNVWLPSEFIEFLEDKIESFNDLNVTTIEDMVSNAKISGFSNLISFEEGYLEIDVMVWRLMFDHVINPIIFNIQKLLDNAEQMRDCRYLCLVGGLACNTYFQSKMKRHFGVESRYNLDVMIPQRPMLCVVEGAAYFGITPNYIKARILKKTYGIKASFTESKARSNGVKQSDIARNRIYIDYYNGYFVKNCFKVLGRKNSEIVNNQIVKYSAKRQPGCEFAKVEILCSDLECPTMVHQGVTLASLKIEFDDGTKQQSDVSINLEFHFYDTQLKVIAFCHHAPSKKKEVEIKYIE